MSKQSSSRSVQSSSVSDADSVKTGPELLKAINKLAETYGFLGTLTTKQRRSSMNSWFDPEYSEAVAARYDAQEALIGGDFDTAQLREGLQFVTAYEAAATAAKTLARAIEDQLLQKKAEVAAETVSIVDVMKGKSRSAKGAALRGDVASLRALRKRGSKKPAETTQPAQPAASQPAVSETSPIVAPAK